MEATHKNLQNYRQGKEPLQNAALQHPTGSAIYDYVKKNVQRNFWMKPFAEWQNAQKRLRNNTQS